MPRPVYAMPKKKNKGKKTHFYTQPPLQSANLKTVKVVNLKTVNLEDVPMPSEVYQPPHQGELIDLTDDLAPEMSANTSKGIQAPQPVRKPQATMTTNMVDNKLNFKFQKTIPKTPDWSKYQSTFKRLGAASPDTDPEEQQQGDDENKTEVNPEPNETVETVNPDSSKQLPIPGEDFLPASIQSQNSTKAKGSQLNTTNKNFKLPTGLKRVKLSNFTKIVQKYGERMNYFFEEQQTELNVNPNLPEIQKKKINELLSEYASIFAFKTEQLGCYSGNPITIRITDKKPVQEMPYETNRRQREIIETQIKRMWENGLIEESTGPYASPVVPVDSSKGFPTLCFDYRFLNQKMNVAPDLVPIPNELLSRLEGAAYFAELDSNCGYWQLALGEGREKTAFISHCGKFHFKKMPFGLNIKFCQVEFLKAMDLILVGVKNKNVIVYEDTILVYSKTFEDFISALGQVLNRLKDANLKLKPSRSNIGYQEVTVLGHKITLKGIGIDERKLQALRATETPIYLTQLRVLLDLFDLYKRFIRNFEQVIQPLRILGERNRKNYIWTQEAQDALDEIKRRLFETPFLAFFSAEKDIITKLYVYVVDNVTLGCWIMQGKEDMIPVTYESRKLTPEEENYAAMEKACLALIWALNCFKHLLFGVKFQLIMNHHSLILWLKKNRFLNERLARWALAVDAWDFKLVYNKGTCILQSSGKKTSDELADLPANVMRVVQEKLKEMPHKKPIIMPKVDEPAPKQTTPSATVVKQAPKAASTQMKVTANKNVPAPQTANKNAPAPHSFRTPASTVFMSDMYGYDYPKGIPKSFLQQPAAPPKSLTPELKFSSLQDFQLQSSVDLPSWILPTQPPDIPPPEPVVESRPEVRSHTPMGSQREATMDRPYSPSDAYSEAAGKMDEESREGSESPDALQPGTKRLSAFKRLGPLTEPKKPKLTINLMINKEQAVREVVDGTDQYRSIPVHLRRDIIQSQDEIVKKYLPFWPWKKNITTRKSACARFSKSVMILEQEQMEAGYEKESSFIMISVKGYPSTWKKEDVLDAILECVKGKSFIPLFTEFTAQECKFLVIRCRPALVHIHKVGFCIRKGEVELAITISLTDTTLTHIDLIPRLVLRKKLISVYDGEKSLDLKEFFIGKEVSHFVYFPLHRVTNQVELIRLQSAIGWEYLTELNLSYNKLTTLDGFDLHSTTPRLKHLDLSHNLLEKVTILLPYRDLPLRSIKLEGNPLCHDYIDSAHYVKVLKMMFSELMEIDGVPLTLKGDLPPMKVNYCPEDAVGIVDKFLSTFFPLLEAPVDYRAAIEKMYDIDAVLTITFRHKLRYGSSFRYFRSLFLRSRNLTEGEMESVRGATSISNLLNKWPAIEHDRYATTVDVLYHDDSTTIFRVSGILKLTAESLAEDEHLLTFTRTVVLHTRNGSEYKIHNEMLYWDVPCEEKLQTAFNITTVRSKQPSLKLEVPPDDELKSKLLEIFIKLTDLDKKRGERCLELKNWDLRNAVDYFIKLLKLDDLSSLNVREDATPPLPQSS